MKYERYKKNSSFSYYMSEFSPNNYFEIILVENSICIAIYILYPKSFLMKCVDLLIDQQAQPLQNVFSSGCPPTTATGEK